MGNAFLLPGLHEFLGLGAHLVVELCPVLFQTLAIAFGSVFRLGLPCSETFELLLPFQCQGVEAFKKVSRVLTVLQKVVPGSCKDAFGQAVLFCNVQGLA